MKSQESFFFIRLRKLDQQTVNKNVQWWCGVGKFISAQHVNRHRLLSMWFIAFTLSNIFLIEISIHVQRILLQLVISADGP